MDLFEKGKSLAREGQFEDALDALVLAWENDKENADIHFFLGLCYSSLEQFSYARYHYEMALILEPEHERTKLVWEGIKDVTPEKPPERRRVRSAEAKARKEEEKKTQPKESTDVEATRNPSISNKIPITDEKWEKAFPSDELTKSKNGGSPLLTALIITLLIVIVGVIAFFIIKAFGLI